MNYAAISTGPETHLDHLAPICALMEMPLIVTDEEQLPLAEKFYPDLAIQHIPLVDLTLERLASFDAIFHCGKFWTLELGQTLQLLFGKAPRLVHCPHGNSDKESGLEQIAPKDLALVYGAQMKRLTTAATVEIGNVRYRYYKERRTHFDKLAEQTVFKNFDPSKKTILYAPTWDSKASPSSFFDSAEELIQSIAGDYNLLIKLHPLLPETHPAHYWRIVGRYESSANLCLLAQFPAVYSLLEKSAVYIGDYSSVGYDFLLYDRPMFFLTSAKQNAFLHQCGKSIMTSELKSWLNCDQSELSAIRKQIYAHAFCADREELHLEIKRTLSIR